MEDTRENWSEHVESWLTDDQYTFDSESADVLDVHTGVTPERIGDRYGVSPNKTIDRTGGTTQAQALLEEFTDRLGAYPSSISAPEDARSGTSQLSPYFRFGCLSIRQAYQKVAAEIGHKRGKEAYISRLYWNRHYNQKLADWSGWMDTAVNPIMEDFHEESHNPEYVTAWKEGATGYPLVDASMRCLQETGWLNFRMRAMCASFFSDLLQQPWQIGADHFYYHLLDADPAINYCQWQLHAGADGTNLMQIYNPRKQVRDNDPDGTFIKKWVPELSGLPAEHLDRPEKTPLHIQADAGVSIGDDYPRPIVEYEAARKSIVAKIESIRDKAKKALSHPEVRRRVSLAQRAETTGTDQMPDVDELQDESTTTSGGQASLSDYS
ncbi:FAD-binding domain-containing protein [Halorubrum sp. BOL3-1]|uniref:FAD-binding domain-containing protein n=1 Tax=Halorubrum sp. BOL3-1 TaxID=2497325 RepID=UPI0014074C80|nr:FAD-binding domain-containing protein [Halorubrum sp. BOL3-1]